MYSFRFIPCSSCISCFFFAAPSDAKIAKCVFLGVGGRTASCIFVLFHNCLFSCLSFFSYPLFRLCAPCICSFAIHMCLPLLLVSFRRGAAQQAATALVGALTQLVSPLALNQITDYMDTYDKDAPKQGIPLVVVASVAGLFLGQVRVCVGGYSCCMP